MNRFFRKIYSASSRIVAIAAMAVAVFTTARATVADGKPEFFARIVPQSNSLIAGDSMLVSVVLYAEYPIAKAECTNTFRVKARKSGKTTARRLSINRDATASRSREGSRVYYTLVWDQYVVAAEGVDEFTVQPLKFKATLQQVTSMPDFFDQMMGARPEVRNVSASCTSEAFTFATKEKPRRSTSDAVRSGSTVL